MIFVLPSYFYKMELKESKPEVTPLFMKSFVVGGNILANEADAKDTAQTIKKFMY